MMENANAIRDLRVPIVHSRTKYVPTISCNVLVPELHVRQLFLTVALVIGQTVVVIMPRMGYHHTDATVRPYLHRRSFKSSNVKIPPMRYVRKVRPDRNMPFVPTVGRVSKSDLRDNPTLDVSVPPTLKDGIVSTGKVPPPLTNYSTVLYISPPKSALWIDS
jgi:hypothetical protein